MSFDVTATFYYHHLNKNESPITEQKHVRCIPEVRSRQALAAAVCFRILLAPDLPLSPQKADGANEPLKWGRGRDDQRANVQAAPQETQSPDTETNMAACAVTPALALVLGYF